jgi:hypothetical protein
MFKRKFAYKTIGKTWLEPLILRIQLFPTAKSGDGAFDEG